jgi:hypothetical protein
LQVDHQFIQETQRAWSKKNESSLEFSTMLERYFLRYDGKGPAPEQSHAYLSANWKESCDLPNDDPTLVAKARDRWHVTDPNKAGDLKKPREKWLSRNLRNTKRSRKIQGIPPGSCPPLVQEGLAGA